MREDDNIRNKVKALAEWIHANYTQHIPTSPNRNFEYNKKRTNGGKVARVVKTNNGYICFFVDQYSISFTSGRFGPGTNYTREERTLSDTVTSTVESLDFHNGSDVQQSETVTITKSHSFTKDLSLEVAFRFLVSSSAEASIEFVKAGTKYEYELSTKLNTSTSETTTNESIITKPILIPPHSSLRYDVLRETSTYRQRVHAEGLMDFSINVDIYNVWNKTFDGIEEFEDFFNGKTGGGHWAESHFRSYPINKSIPNELRNMKLSMVIKTENAKTGRTSLTPIPPE